MKLKQAIKVLKHYNSWRRGDIEDVKYTPKQIGIALDVVLFMVEHDVR